MPKRKILQDDRDYTFRSYFELPYGIDEILAEFDYAFTTARLSLPKTTQALDRLPELKQQIEDILPFVRLSNESARREMLVSPGGETRRPLQRIYPTSRGVNCSIAS